MYIYLFIKLSSSLSLTPYFGYEFSIAMSDIICILILLYYYVVRDRP